ncbi:MAG: hypothetical protein AMS15_00300 [Planctomycetes bacterium DG_23]|nr:MAG: hypothetical protein AMS15_00300 [Planctomycetes bacterium DG_23]
MLDIQHLLQEMVAKKGSDLHIAAGSPPRIRAEGRLTPIKHPVLSPKETEEAIYKLLSKEEIERFERDWELETSIDISGLGKFNASIFRQRGAVGAVFRSVS